MSKLKDCTHWSCLEDRRRKSRVLIWWMSGLSRESFRKKIMKNWRRKHNHHFISRPGWWGDQEEFKPRKILLHKGRKP